MHYVKCPEPSISGGLVANCPFCARLADVRPDDPAEWTVLARTERFVAVPSVGPLVPGWLLVLPTSHQLSFGDLDSTDDAATEVESIAASWGAEFGPLTWFEHGPVHEDSVVGCGVDHAHMHLVPLKGLDLLGLAAARMPSLHFERIDGLGDIDSSRQPGSPYLYLREESGQSWLASSDAIPSQFFRRLIAETQGRPEEFDWKCHPHRKMLTSTLRRVERRVGI
jgi:diadenosine tetraphosphate (Ap4A) HIT family hydrolase